VRLLVLTAGELARDPRARRAALAAVARGHEVVGLAGATREVDEPLDGVHVVHVRTQAVSQALRRAGLGGMKPSPPLVRELRGVYRLIRLARRTAALALTGAKLGRFDVVHANDFDTLPAAWVIARRTGARLVYDSHELYADQEPSPPRAYRAAVARLEGVFGRRADAVVTVSDPIAEELAGRLGLHGRPFVVLNCPPRGDRERTARPHEGLLQAVYQGAMGPGRLLSDLLAAAKHAPSVELTLRVAGAELSAIRDEVRALGLEERLRVVEPVEQAELVRALRPFHVGLIINRPVTRNDELVFPNKLFEYMMAGLAVVVPRLPGLAPFVEGEGIGVCFEPARPDALGAVLERLAAEREAVSEMGHRAERLALDRYNAETQAEELFRAWDGAGGRRR
jgi:glycosyltransferase involved in cell wall biosynthesis